MSSSVYIKRTCLFMGAQLKLVPERIQRSSKATAHIEASTMVSYFSPYAPDVALKSLFQKYDRDNSGRLDRGELVTFFQDDLGLNSEQAEVYMYLLDEDGDTGVSFVEFKSWLNSGERFRNIDNHSRFFMIQNAIDLFKKYDVDSNQALDLSELEQLLLDMGGHSCYLQEALKALDRDGNKRVSFTEFLIWLNWVPLDRFD